MKVYRDNGAIGALLDEYEKAILELIETIASISEQELTTIVDKTTDDPTCRSIQTILSHVVRAGYTYTIEIRQHLGEEIDHRTDVSLGSSLAYQEALLTMFQANVALFEEYPTIVLEEHEQAKKKHVRWGQYYDVEQLMEHAIVHILRHRRQIERFLIRLML